MQLLYSVRPPPIKRPVSSTPSVAAATHVCHHIMNIFPLSHIKPRPSSRRWVNLVVHTTVHTVYTPHDHLTSSSIRKSGKGAVRREEPEHLASVRHFFVKVQHRLYCYARDLMHSSKPRLHSCHSLSMKESSVRFVSVVLSHRYYEPYCEPSSSTVSVKSGNAMGTDDLTIGLLTTKKVSRPDHHLSRDSMKLTSLL